MDTLEKISEDLGPMRFLDQLESSILKTLLSLRETIPDTQKPRMAKLSGLTNFFPPATVEEFKEKHAETCLLFKTNFPMVIDPAHTDEAVIGRTSKFLASLILSSNVQYNKFAVPLNLYLDFDENLIGQAVIEWAHHIELDVPKDPE